jgi:hypothetical protein
MNATMTSRFGRSAVLAGGAAAALLLTACGGPALIHHSSGDNVELKSLASLNCPEREDQLRRVSVSPDGKTCTYAGEGAEVRLQLVTMNGRTPDAVLSGFETELRTLMPRANPPSAAPMGALSTETSTVLGVEENGDEAHVRMPGLSVDAQGDRAQVRIGGVTIDADDDRSVVKVRSHGGEGATTVNADESGAEIRMVGDETSAVRRSVILASDTPSPAGWRMAGYEARGPQAGPVLVATIRSREKDADDPMDAMHDLVRKMVGA